MNQILQFGRLVGSVAALSELAWTAYEYIRFENDQNVLIKDAFEFFREHPEHLPGVYLVLAVAGITVLFISNANWAARFWRKLKARTPKHRLRAMVTDLEIEMRASENANFLDFQSFDPERIVERQTIGMELRALGIPAPRPNDEHRKHVAFLTIIIPYARHGNVRAARQAAKKCIAAMP